MNSCRWVELSDTCSTVTGSDNISCSGLQVVTDFTLIPDTSDPTREWFKAQTPKKEFGTVCFCLLLFLFVVGFHCRTVAFACFCDSIKGALGEEENE